MEELTGPYPFESDHVALKGNADYHNMLTAIAMLEAQKTKAIKDIDILLKCRDDALKDPIAFAHKLQHGVDMGFPGRQKVTELPRIDWSRYSEQTDSSNQGHRHATRHQKQQSNSEQNSARSSRSSTPVPLGSGTAASTPQPGEDSDQGALALVRGKRRDEAKPPTFNKLWSVEEQARLEELLVKYPPEEVEARRWEKIARELGSRTRQQVQSRVQKYFIRLAKEGMPVPGRVPYNLHQSRRRIHAHHRSQHLLYPTSTFCVSYKPPVYMSDDDESSTSAYTPDTSFTYAPVTSQNATVSDEEDVPEELRDSEEYAEIMRLKMVKKDAEAGAIPQRHLGYKCDRCGVEPIMGTRWHCQDCPEHMSTDFCDACADFTYEAGEHKSWHTLTDVHTAGRHSHLDHDYRHSQFLSGDYNYLDPNFLPAT